MGESGSSTRRPVTARAAALPRREALRAPLVATALVLFSLALVLLGAASARAAVDTSAPASPVKLVFIHHSTGEGWLADGHGGLGLALRDNDYFVSDTNYGWAADLPASRGEPIGSTTDLGDWWTWFRGPDAPEYLSALYAESGQNCSYTRMANDPGGPNEIVMFKSCFPNSDLHGDPSAAIPAIGANPLKGQAAGGDAFTVANAKGIYLDLLQYFAAHQEKLFVAIVAPPIQHPGTPADGRAMADWLVDHWLDGYGHANVFVWDYYDVLTSNTGAADGNDAGLESGNHHRIWHGAVQHKTDDGVDHLVYPSGDDHPNRQGDLKATAEFVPMLNNAYHAWKGSDGGGGDTTGPVTQATRAVKVRKGRSATLYFQVTDDQSASATVTIRITTKAGKLKKTLTLGLQPTGRELSTRFRCRLARGSYRYTVDAVDLTGNAAQQPLGSARLRVR